MFRPGDPVPAELAQMFDGPVGFMVPMRGVDQVFGVVIADCFAGDLDISEERLGLAVEVTRQAGIAYGNADQLADVRTRVAQRCARCTELGKRLLASTDLARELVLLTRCASEVTSSLHGMLWLKDGNEFKLKARWARSDAAPDARLEAHLARVAQRTALSGEVEHTPPPARRGLRGGRAGAGRGGPRGLGAVRAAEELRPGGGGPRGARADHPQRLRVRPLRPARPAVPVHAGRLRRRSPWRTSA